MRAGSLRHLVTIQTPVETQNSFGEPEVRWQDLHTNIWANIMPISGREYFAAKQTVAEVSARIVMRYVEGITAKMKIVHGANEYLIEEIINENERNRMLTMMCTRVIE